MSGASPPSRTDLVPPPPAGGAPSSTRRPYPWHALLQVGADAPAGLMLRDGLVGRRVLPVERFQAPVQEEATSDVYRERSYSWRKMGLGYGDASQQSNGVPARYAYASNAWHSGPYRGLGPRFRALDLPDVPGGPDGEVIGFAEAVHEDPGPGGTPVTRLFALAGRYVRRWDGPTGAEQALSLDLGAGYVVRSWTRWAAGGPTGQDALYLTDSRSPLGHLWRYQDAGWTDLTAAGAPPAAFVLATGVELWRVCGTPDQPDAPYAVSKCEGDPTVPANWTAPIPVGDASVLVTGLSELQMRLFVHKEDATVWALQGGADTGTARNLTPDLRESRSSENGKRPAALAGGPLLPGRGHPVALHGGGRGAGGPGAPGGQHRARAGPRAGLRRRRRLVRPGGALQRQHRDQLPGAVRQLGPRRGDLPRRRGAPVRARAGTAPCWTSPASG